MHLFTKHEVKHGTTGRYEIPLLMPSQAPEARQPTTKRSLFSMASCIRQSRLLRCWHTHFPPLVDDMFFVAAVGSGDWFAQDGKLAILTRHGLALCTGQEMAWSRLTLAPIFL